MAAAHRMSTYQGNDLLIIKPHAIKDVSNVIVALGGIRETAIRGAVRSVGSISAAGSPWDDRSGCLFDSDDSSQRPQIRIGESGVLGLDRLEQVSSDL